jgi:hypothetical protein
VLGVSEIEQDGDDVLWAAIAVRVWQVLSGFFGLLEHHHWQK